MLRKATYVFILLNLVQSNIWPHKTAEKNILPKAQALSWPLCDEQLVFK